MTSNSTISNYTRFTKVTLLETVTGQFLYTRLAITRSLTGVETEKGSERVFVQTINCIAMYGVLKEGVASGSNNA